jgi:hypothetical protein
MQKQKNTNIYAYGILSIGIVIGSWFIGTSIKSFKTDDRTVTVKGFSEKDVKSDLVIWNMKVRIVDNDLQAGSMGIENARQKVVAFLINKGIKNNEITVKDLNVIDKQADEYNSSGGFAKYRYLIEESIEVRSTNVDLVKEVSRMTNELLNAGVVLSTKNDWRTSGLRFMFTKLNEIKPAMVKDAIQNARQAAQEFANESNAELGKLKRAQQGYFTVQDRDASLNSGVGEGGYYDNSSSDVFKKVRVVIALDYSIN